MDINQEMSQQRKEIPLLGASMLNALGIPLILSRYLRPGSTLQAQNKVKGLSKVATPTFLEGGAGAHSLCPFCSASSLVQVEAMFSPAPVTQSPRGNPNVNFDDI